MTKEFNNLQLGLSDISSCTDSTISDIDSSFLDKVMKMKPDTWGHIEQDCSKLDPEVTTPPQKQQAPIAPPAPRRINASYWERIEGMTEAILRLSMDMMDQSMELKKELRYARMASRKNH